jgi:hypothetical protein
MRYRELANFFFLFLMMSFCSPSFSESSLLTDSAAAAAPITHSDSATGSSPSTRSNPTTQSDLRSSSDSAMAANQEARQNNVNQVQANITLDSIEAKKLSKKSGDKIYISITEYSNLDHGKTTRLPEKTTFWTSKQLAEIKNQILWSGKIKDNEEIKLIFSVVEQDVSSWDVDDLIGSAQLRLLNKNGKIENKWELPVFEEHTEVVLSASASGKVTSKQRFIMKGLHSEYLVTLSYSMTDPAIKK